MTDIEALRARMRCDVTGNLVGTDTRMIGAPLCECQGCRADAEITRLREDLDRVTRERDEARRIAGAQCTRLRETVERLRDTKTRAEKAEADLADARRQVTNLSSGAHVWNAERNAAVTRAFQAERRADAAEASLAKRDEEVAGLKGLILEARNVVSVASEALGCCYDVCDYPANGRTTQDVAKKACDLLFARLDTLTKEPTNAE